MNQREKAKLERKAERRRRKEQRRNMPTLLTREAWLAMDEAVIRAAREALREWADVQQADR
jgi:hypothetical protein